jgi:stage V sporulation protein B
MGDDMERPTTSAARVGAPRGAVLMTLAQGVFVLVSVLLHFWLGRRLGPEQYGTFGVLLVVYSLVNLLQNSGVWPAMSKRIAETLGEEPSILGAGLVLQLKWTAITTLAGLALAWPLAATLGDRALAAPIAITVALVPLFSLYGLANGVHNGRHAFDRQAGMLTGYALGRLAFTAALVLVAPPGLGALAAIVGFSASPLAGLVAGIKGLPRPVRSGALGHGIARFAGPVTVAAGSLVVVMSLDVLAVKSLLGDPLLVGHYGAASTFASLPYFLFSALSVVVLPAVSTARADRGVEEAARLISRSLKVVVVLLAPVVLLPAVLAAPLVTLVYGGAYRGAGDPLTILLVGYGLLTYALIQQNVANGLGRQHSSMVAGLTAAVVSAGANLLLVPRFGLRGAALATLLAGVAMVAALRPALRADGVSSQPARWLVALLPTGLVAGLLAYLYPGDISAAAAVVIGGAVCILSARALGALDAEDVSRLVSALGARAPGG